MRERRRKKKKREREEKGERRKEIRFGPRDPIVKEKGLDARWRDLFAKNRKQRRVAARGRGWEKKKPGENLGFEG